MRSEKNARGFLTEETRKDQLAEQEPAEPRYLCHDAL